MSILCNILFFTLEFYLSISEICFNKSGCQKKFFLFVCHNEVGTHNEIMYFFDFLMKD